MAEPFKNLISRQTVTHAARHLARAWPEFDRARFEQLAGDNFEGLELKARALQIAEALAQTLPADFTHACAILERSLASPIGFDADGEPVGLGEAARDAGLSGWAVWSMGEYVARHGMDHVPRALACLHALT
ncbi:MAG TPA: hypothetical protein VK178_07770, partial [Opitutaceae bacterium]|nr:hypothetical protein [Opitutaceae bacterium]